MSEEVVALGIGEELEGELFCAFCCEVLSEGMGEEKVPERLRLVEPESDPADKSAALMAAPESPVEGGAWIDVLGRDGGGGGSPSCREEELKRME